MRAALEVVRRRALLVLSLGVAALPLVPVAAAAENEKAAAVFAALAPLLATKEDAADAEQRDIMPVTSSLPWGAVGFLDNGCSGALIDSQHVLAASHCFTFDFDGVTADGKPYLQGAWQTGLVFFPNYHPSRVDPPRYEIDRVIVGSRAQTDPATAADWGIGHLAKPVKGFPALSVAPRERWQYPSFVLFAGYGRDEEVYPAGAASFPEPSPGGFCANFKGNCWWIPAFTDPKCLALDEVDGIVRTDEFSCRTLGGNSGSPVLWQAASLEPQAFRVTGVISGGGFFWSAQRFQHAPRFAAGVAVASHDDGTKRTQVFATDRDRSRIASRHRTGTSSAEEFTYFRDLGSVPSPGPLAAFRLPDGRPQVVVLGGDGKIYTNHVAASGKWQAWKTMAGPAGVAGFLDLAAAPGSDGLPQLFLVGGDHRLYRTRATSAPAGATWQPWSKVPAVANASRVSLVRHESGRLQALVVSTAGTVESLAQSDAGPGAAWSAPTDFGTSTLRPLADVTAAWTPAGRVKVFAVDEAGDGWTRIAEGSSPQAKWGPWTSWSVPLHASKAATPPRLDGIVSLTASRWLEGGRAILPVVFATDEQGNIYVTTQAGDQWLPWRSFYN